MGKKFLKLLLLVGAVYLGMKYIFPIVLPFFIALILARLLYPLARKTEKFCKGNRAFSRSLVYILFLLALGLICAGLLYLCYRMGSGCVRHFNFIVEKVQVFSGECCRKVEEISGLAADDVGEKVGDMVKGMSNGAVEISKEAGACVLSFLAKALVTLVAAFLILHEYEYVFRLFQKTWAGQKAFEILRNMKSAFGAYLKAQIIIMGIITFICVAGMFLTGTNYALAVGIFIGIFDALPFLGTGTILVPWTFMDLLMGRYLAGAGHFLIYLLCTCVRQFLEPRLVGKTLGVPPLFVLMSLYIGIQVYGGAGVLLGPISALLIYEIWLINREKEGA